MKTLDINRLRERVRIEYPLTVSDGQGGQTVSWVTLAEVFAEVEPTNSYTTQRNLADQVSARAGYRVTMRARRDVDASMRIIWKTHTLVIGSLHEVDALLEIRTYEEAL
jgi:SPP1 family predicted phage head-tail adaptor